MLYNFYFDICAIIILLAIIGITLFRAWVPTHRNRMFMFLLLAVLGATLAERLDVLLQISGRHTESWYQPVEMAICSVFFVCHLLSALAYLTYILALLNIHVSFGSHFVIVYVPWLIGTGMVLVNLVSPILFYYDAQGYYNRGPFLVAYYVLAAHYLFVGLLMVYRNRRIIRRQTTIIMTSYVVFILVGQLIQFIWPSMLVEEFVYALALALTYITIQSPSEMIDPELQILNRKAYLSGISMDVSRNAPDTSIFLCVDHIESIGEQIGRVQVVALLRMIVAYLKRFSRFGYLYRYGTEVFVLTLQDMDEASQNRIMQQITARFRDPWVFRDMQVRVGCCAFVLRRPEHFHEIGDLIQTVSILSEPRWHAGRQILDVSEVDLDHARRDRRVIKLLRDSIDDGTAEVRYQPVKTSGEYRIVGYDACLMILDPSIGTFIPASRHITDRESSGALADADEYALRRVCRFLRICRESGEPCPVIEVRLSWSEVARPDFKEQMQDILRIEGISFSMLCFKLRETTLSNLSHRQEDVINWLVARGASVAIEGFGMGYADIARLRRIHVSNIILDHSLLEAADATEFRTLVRGIIDMLHDIRIKVTIDEIRNRREAELARDLGCDYLKGDFLGEPKAEQARLPLTGKEGAK